MSFLRVLSLLICSFVAITFVSSDREKSGEQILDEYFNSVIEQEELLSQLDEHTIQGNHYDILEISDLLSKKRESQQIQLNQLIQGKWLPVAEEEQSEAYYERILNHLLHKSEDHQVAFHTILWQMQKWWEGRYLSKLHDISIRNMDVAMTTGGALGAAAIAPWHIKAKRGSGFLRGMYRFLPKRYAVLIMYTLPVTLGTSAGVVTAGASNRYGLFLDGIPPSPMHYYGEKIGLAAEVASYNAEDILTDIAHTCLLYTSPSPRDNR